MNQQRHERVRPLPGSAGAVPAGHPARGTIPDLRPTRGGGRGFGASAPDGGGPDRFFDNGNVEGAMRALGRALRRAWHAKTGPGRPSDRPRVGQRVAFAVGTAPRQPQRPSGARQQLMTQTHDYRYRYPESPVPCRIRVYRAGAQTVCLATQRQDKFGGAALSEHAARIATQVAGWHHPVPDGRFAWVEHYEFPRGPDAQGRWETFAWVTFQRGVDGALCGPAREPTDRAAVEALIGQAVGA